MRILKRIGITTGLVVMLILAMSALSTNVGGTGLKTTDLTQGDLFTYTTAQTKLTRIPAVASGKYLMSNGVGSKPTWEDVVGSTAGTTFTGHITVEGVTATGATGTGKFVFDTAPTISAPTITGAAAITGAATIRTTSPSIPMGYGTGAGGIVTQATDKSTGVTLAKSCGVITMNNASLAANASVSFTVTCTSVMAAGDIPIVAVASPGAGTGKYTAHISAAALNSYQITVTNVGSTASEVVVLNVGIIKGSAN